MTTIPSSQLQNSNPPTLKQHEQAIKKFSDLYRTIEKIVSSHLSNPNYTLDAGTAKSLSERFMKFSYDEFLVINHFANTLKIHQLFNQLRGLLEASKNDDLTPESVTAFEIKLFAPSTILKLQGMPVEIIIRTLSIDQYNEGKLSLKQLGCNTFTDLNTLVERAKAFGTPITTLDLSMGVYQFQNSDHITGVYQGRLHDGPRIKRIHLTPPMIDMIKSMEELRVLRLNGLEIEVKLINAISKLQLLKELELGWGALDMSKFCKLKELKKLSIIGQAPAPYTYCQGDFPALQELFFDCGNKEHNFKVLTSLAKQLPQLRILKSPSLLIHPKK